MGSRSRRMHAPSRLVAAALIVSAVGAPGATLRGNVVNGSGGDAGSPVMINVTCIGCETKIDKGIDDGRGGFVFENLPGGRDHSYFLRAMYEEIPYTMQFHLSEDADTTVTVTVYDLTDDDAAVTIDEGKIDLIPLEDGLRIDQVFRIRNSSNPPRTVRGSPEGNVVIPLPITVSDPDRLVLAFSTGIVPLRSEPIFTGEPKRVAADYPIRPGITTVAVSFDVAYPGSFVYDTVLPWDLASLRISAALGLDVSGEKVMAPVKAGTGTKHTTWPIAPLSAGEELTVMITGFYEGAPADRPGGGSNATGRVVVGDAYLGGGVWLFMGALAAVLFGALALSASKIRGDRR